jgi:hypothetical protein
MGLNLLFVSFKLEKIKEYFGKVFGAIKYIPKDRKHTLKDDDPIFPKRFCIIGVFKKNC